MKKASCIFGVLIVIAWWFYPGIVRNHDSKWSWPLFDCKIMETAGGPSENKLAAEDGEAAKKRWEQSGQHGDTYGGFTSLFSALALLGLVVTAWLQYRQLVEQRLQHKAENMPYVEWDAPVLHVIGVCKEGKRLGLAMVLKIKVGSFGKEPVLNFVSQCEIQDDNGVVLAQMACSNQGSSFTDEVNLLGLHYSFLENTTAAVKILNSLVNRNPVRLIVRACYMNHAGETFIRKKQYELDCPASDDRRIFERLAKMISAGWAEDEESDRELGEFIKSINTLIIEDKDTFTQPFAMAITKVAPLEAGAILSSEYERNVKGWMDILRANAFPITCAQLSFFVKTRMALAVR